MLFKRNVSRTNSRGFTLIELLVTIAIIGILSAIIITALGDARKKARIASAKSSLSSVPAAMAMCLNGGGNINAPTINGGNAICSNTSVIDTVYPNLTNNSKWTWGIRVAPSANNNIQVVDDNVDVMASCSPTNCGVQQYAICGITGCNFFTSNSSDFGIYNWDAQGFPSFASIVVNFSQVPNSVVLKVDGVGPVSPIYPLPNPTSYRWILSGYSSGSHRIEITATKNSKTVKKSFLWIN